MRKVAVLFADRDSVYKTLPDLDVYDIERDALTFPGGMPIVAHPPCRLWGRLRAFSTAPESEKELALWAVDQVRRNGGVLEHPAWSKLWEAKGLPFPGKGKDEYGGWTLGFPQYWFGHKARKETFLYIVGVEPEQTPPIPLVMGEAEFVVSTSKRKHGAWKPELTKRERRATPKELAEWLVETARRSR